MSNVRAQIRLPVPGRSGWATAVRAGGVLLAVAALASAPASYADDGGPNTAEIRLADDMAHVVVRPPSTVFRKFDDNEDSLIQPEELDAHRSAILTLLRDGFTVADNRGNKGEPMLETVSLPKPAEDDDEDADGKGKDGAEHLEFALRYWWWPAPEWLEVEYTLHAEEPMTISSARVTASPVASKQKPLAPFVKTVFDRENPAHRLFEGDGKK